MRGVRAVDPIGRPRECPSALTEQGARVQAMKLNARDLTIFDRERLRGEFGEFIGRGPGAFSSQVERELHGRWYRETLDQMSMVVAHQWSRGIHRSALRGFFLHGPPGLGKTTLVKRVSFELCRIFEHVPPGDVAVPVRLVLIDGADLARSRYGETEELLDALFDFGDVPLKGIAFCKKTSLRIDLHHRGVFGNNPIIQ